MQRPDNVSQLTDDLSQLQMNNTTMLQQTTPEPTSPPGIKVATPDEILMRKCHTIKGAITKWHQNSYKNELSVYAHQCQDRMSSTEQYNDFHTQVNVMKDEGNIDKMMVGSFEREVNGKKESGMIFYYLKEDLAIYLFSNGKIACTGTSATSKLTNIIEHSGVDRDLLSTVW